MNTLNIWIEIKNLNGVVLHTLDQRKPFEIISVTDNTVIVLPKSTGKERPIHREGIENAYRHLTVTGRLTLDELEKEFTPRNPVYTAAILAKIPGVQYKVNPIRLLVSK